MGNQDLINPLMPREPNKPAAPTGRRVTQTQPQPGVPNDEQQHADPSHEELETLEKELASRDYFRRRRRRKQRRRQTVKKRIMAQLDEVVEQTKDDSDPDHHLDLFV